MKRYLLFIVVLWLIFCTGCKVEIENSMHDDAQKTAEEWISNEWSKTDIIEFFIKNKKAFDKIIAIFQEKGWSKIQLICSANNESQPAFYDLIYLNEHPADNDEICEIKEVAQWFFDHDILEIYYCQIDREVCEFRFGWTASGIRLGAADDFMYIEPIVDGWYFYHIPQV